MTAVDPAVPVSKPGAKGLCGSADAHGPHPMPCDSGCQPDWHRDSCAIYGTCPGVLAAHTPEGAEGEREAWERGVLEHFITNMPACRETPDFVSVLSSAMLHQRAPEADPTAGERCIYCDKTRSAHGLSSRLCLQSPGGTEFAPAEPDAGDVEALAKALREMVDKMPETAEWAAHISRVAAATADRARREGAVKALREAAEAVSFFGEPTITGMVSAWLRTRADRLETP